MSTQLERSQRNVLAYFNGWIASREETSLGALLLYETFSSARRDQLPLGCSPPQSAAQFGTKVYPKFDACAWPEPGTALGVLSGGGRLRSQYQPKPQRLADAGRLQLVERVAFGKYGKPVHPRERLELLITLK